MSDPIPPPPSPPPLPSGQPGPAVPPPSRGRRHTVWSWILSVVGVVLAVAIIAGFVVHLPYVIISPGSATPLDSSVIEITDAPTYPHAGDIRFLTVRVSTHDPSLWALATAWLDPDRDVEKRTDVLGCLSDNDNASFNTALMDQSQNDAKYVALTRLGYTVTADPPQVIVVEVCRGAPAYEKLHGGDRILAVDGHTISDISQVAPLVQAHHPGDPVRITYERAARADTVTVVSGRVVGAKTTSPKCVPVAERAKRRSSTAGTPCLGITTQAFVSYQFPINVQINTIRVGGPSAGLAFTLAIIDELTRGSLTGRKRVAVTGAIAPDGSVGEVGGVEQKAITARENGVQLMIVPKPELQDARRGAGKLRVVGVSTVDQALAALQSAGGAPVPPRSSTAARS